MQKYLKTEEIQVNEAKNVFKFRTKSANFKVIFETDMKIKGGHNGHSGTFSAV